MDRIKLKVYQIVENKGWKVHLISDEIEERHFEAKLSEQEANVIWYGLNEDPEGFCISSGLLRLRLEEKDKGKYRKMVVQERKNFLKASVLFRNNNREKEKIFSIGRAIALAYYYNVHLTIESDFLEDNKMLAHEIDLYLSGTLKRFEKNFDLDRILESIPFMSLKYLKSILGEYIAKEEYVIAKIIIDAIQAKTPT